MFSVTKFWSWNCGQILLWLNFLKRFRSQKAVYQENDEYSMSISENMFQECATKLLKRLMDQNWVEHAALISAAGHILVFISELCTLRLFSWKCMKTSCMYKCSKRTTRRSINIPVHIDSWALHGVVILSYRCCRFGGRKGAFYRLV